MKKSLAHLPKRKRNELARIVERFREKVDDIQMLILFGSYARGDFKDGPHSQGRGRLFIHKTSDYDILVLTEYEHTARNITLWDKVKQKLAQCNLSAHVRIIDRDIDFFNFKLRAYPNNRVVMRPSEKFEAKAVGLNRRRLSRSCVEDDFDPTTQASKFPWG